MKTTFKSYVVVSFLSAFAVLLHAMNLKRYFFNAVIYLSRSKFATVVLGNAAVAVLLLCGKLVQAVFLGPLRFREEERLHIRVREAVIETCLAMTVFREEFNSKFIAMFAILLFLKVFHWLGKDRIEYLEEQPNATALAHARLVGLMSVLFALDMHLLVSCVSTTLRHGPSMMVLFAFEFAVLLISLVFMILRYLLSVADAYLDGHWDAKGMLSFYNELLADVLQLMVYMAFFLYVQMYYTLPLHIVRDIYLTFTKFQRRVSEFMRYRRVANSMNELFRDATEEDFEEGDRTCIVCREDMRVAKKLSCGHIFHTRCLQSWLRRQLTCPVCRAAVNVSAASNQRPGGGSGGGGAAAERAGAAAGGAGVAINNNNNNNNGAQLVGGLLSRVLSATDGVFRRMFRRRPRHAQGRPPHPYGAFPSVPFHLQGRGAPGQPHLQGRPAFFLPPPPLAPWMMPPPGAHMRDPLRFAGQLPRGMPVHSQFVQHPTSLTSVRPAEPGLATGAPVSAKAGSASASIAPAENASFALRAGSVQANVVAHPREPTRSPPVEAHASRRAPSSALSSEALGQLLRISEQLDALRDEVHAMICDQLASAPAASTASQPASSPHHQASRS